VCLRFVYLLVVRIVPTLRPRRCGGDHKTIEILLLRHQLAVLQRQLAATGKRPRPDWADRAIIALLLGLVPKARRAGLRLFVTPDTILRWHRDLLRRRWVKKSCPKNGRPATHRNIKSLVLRLARQNPAWGYRRIHGELAGLGIAVAASTVWEILKTAGIEPAPRRGSATWASFLRPRPKGP
jgi:putative transposase